MRRLAERWQGVLLTLYMLGHSLAARITHLDLSKVKVKLLSRGSGAGTLGVPLGGTRIIIKRFLHVIILQKHVFNGCIIFHPANVQPVSSSD